jgi:hypothetical protein
MAGEWQELRNRASMTLSYAGLVKLPMRINARLDEDSAAQLEYIRKTTQQNLTDIIKHSVELYYRELQLKQQDRNQRLLESDFVGCGAAEPELSTRYKSILSEQLARKHDHR